MSEALKAVKIIKKNISALNLNLKGLTILTEVGSNYYLYTPIIPLLAGAAKVIAYVKDSPYGKAADIKTQCEALAKKYNVTDRLVVYDNLLPDTAWKEADIVTNSAMLRPLNAYKLKHLKKGAVIPLMFEAWEIRETDIDMRYCKENGIRVAGTWEGHPAVNVFEYVGALAVKMAFEAGYPVLNNNIAVWSDDNFGKTIKAAFEKNGANCLLTTNKHTLNQNLDTLDFIFIADYSEERNYASEESALNIASVLQVNEGLGIIHLYGHIQVDHIPKSYIGNIHPEKNGLTKVMSRTLAYVGFEPFARLLIAGLKTGEELYYNNLTELSQEL